ncbi:PRC-barrel domain-containing protein [Halomonas sp. TRM85114]|uniref:PRC-barrel domain-containing protein n=1 Tax=Halomonas jincaotanensis TaxID=2810616 RepID=UPI001BD29834|nr:PRC-barrel domain-containing protein [Halomonas jincaotanensis]MBS9402195.1 PRC-barrel domain-containing protein [Halomonas jincaotanensis]
MKRTALAIAIGAISAGISMGTWAQDPPDAETQENQTETQPASEQASSEQDNEMDVQVEEQPAEVQVEQEAPDITVEQEPPEVTIEQPEPEVTITQPEPNVEIQEAEPEVTVEDTGEPEVTIESSGEPEVTVEDQEQQEEQDQQQEQEQPPEEQEQAQQEESSGSSSALMSMQVSDLEGMTVNNQDGEEIGEVRQISQHNQSGDLYAIVGVGGFLGIGRSDIAMALDEMEMQGEELVLTTNRTQDEIEQSSEDYNEDDYTQVDSDTTLSEASSQ